MKSIRILVLIVSFFYGTSAFAHNAHYDPALLRTWFAGQPGKELKASFFLKRGNEVFLEKADGSLISVPFAQFPEKDQAFIQQKTEWLKALHTEKVPDPNPFSPKGFPVYAFFFLALLMAVAWAKRSRFAVSVFVSALVTSGMLAFRTKSSMAVQTDLDPISVDSAFSPFKPAVYTHWDNQWFYVESKGLPSHEMMTGITKWQQQTPIPQCYTGSNAWQIPLHPVPAATPVPVNQEHFLRGAVAIAANGIPIFNPYTNTGVDALLDGQLDQWGGHSGRADDYHYHIAPLHLYAQSHFSKPIAYGLDGFPIYGSLEPDGSPMNALDENHGHLGSNGIYHYHGTATAPYMIGKMVGQVTEDATLQIVPQAAAHPVRPSGTPLNGASITAFTANGTGNGYTLFYTRNNENYSWAYSWNANNVFTFNYVTPTGTTTTNYNGQAPCSLPVSVKNPVSGKIRFQLHAADRYVKLLGEGENGDLPSGSLRIMNLGGKQIWSGKVRGGFEVKGLPAGMYPIEFQDENGTKTCEQLRLP